MDQTLTMHTSLLLMPHDILDTYHHTHQEHLAQCLSSNPSVPHPWNRESKQIVQSDKRTELSALITSPWYSMVKRQR